MAQVSNTNKVLKGMSSQTLVTIMLGVMSVLSFSIMSRLLTKEDFGFYAAITAITTIFSSFSETGIGAALIQKKEINKRYIDNAFTINLLFGLFISLLLVALAGPLSRAVVDSSIETPLRLMSIPLLCNCLVSVNYSMMKRRLQFLRVGLISLISNAVGLAVAIALALRGFGYYTIIFQSIIGGVIMLLLSYLLNETRFGFALDKANFKSIFSFSGWLMASVVFRNIAQHIDRLMMPRLISVESLGAYNRPKEFIGQISSRLNGIFDTALFPVLSGIQDERERLASAFKRSFYYMNMFALLLTLAVVFNSELMIRIFFGNDWLDLRNLTMVIACSLLFNIDGRLADCYLRSMGMTKQQFYFRIVETIVASAAVVLGFRWGVMGVAVTVMVSNAIIKIIKITYISLKVNVSFKELMGVLFSSWKFGLYVIPPVLLAFMLSGHSIIGNIITISVFIIVTVLMFLAFPKRVGQRYEQEAYQGIISFLKNKFRKQ